MKFIISILFTLTISVFVCAQDSHFSYDFSTAPKWIYYSNKNSSCKVKNGEYLLTSTGKLSMVEFSNDYHHGDFKEGRLSAAFTPTEIDENSIYGLSGGYHGHALYTPEGTYPYYHIIFEINKMKRTYSVYDFNLNGDQYIHDGVPNYIVKDRSTDEIKISGKDELSYCRMNGQWKFIINTVVVCSHPDTSTQLNTSMGIILRNKTSVALDYISYNYKPKLYLQTVPESTCDEKSKRFVNKEYGYSLCLDNTETASELTYEQYNYEYLKDFVLIKGFTDLPFNVYALDFKTETDSLLVFKKFEEEFFIKVGEAIAAKELYMDVYTKPEPTEKHGSYFRGYKITLPSGEHALVCFDYLLANNDMFDALCFGYMAPDGVPGLVYPFHNKAMMLQCDVLRFW